MKWSVFARRAAARASIVWEFLYFLSEQKRWWLIPMIIVLVLFGVLLIFAQGSVFGPFVYTLF